MEAYTAVPLVDIEKSKKDGCRVCSWPVRLAAVTAVLLIAVSFCAHERHHDEQSSAHSSLLRADNVQPIKPCTKHNHQVSNEGEWHGHHHGHHHSDSGSRSMPFHHEHHSWSGSRSMPYHHEHQEMSGPPPPFDPRGPPPPPDMMPAHGHMETMPAHDHMDGKPSFLGWFGLSTSSSSSDSSDVDYSPLLDIEDSGDELGMDDEYFHEYNAPKTVAEAYGVPEAENLWDSEDSGDEMEAAVQNPWVFEGPEIMLPFDQSQDVDEILYSGSEDESDEIGLLSEDESHREDPAEEHQGDGENLHDENQGDDEDLAEENQGDEIGLQYADEAEKEENEIKILEENGELEEVERVEEP